MTADNEFLIKTNSVGGECHGSPEFDIKHKFCIVLTMTTKARHELILWTE